MLILLSSADRTTGSLTNFKLNFNNTISGIHKISLMFATVPATNTPAPPELVLLISIPQLSTNINSTSLQGINAGATFIVPQSNINTQTPFCYTACLFPQELYNNYPSAINSLDVIISQSDGNANYIGGEWTMLMNVE